MDNVYCSRSIFIFSSVNPRVAKAAGYFCAWSRFCKSNSSRSSRMTVHAASGRAALSHQVCVESISSQWSCVDCSNIRQFCIPCRTLLLIRPLDLPPGLAGLLNGKASACTSLVPLPSARTFHARLHGKARPAPPGAGKLPGVNPQAGPAAERANALANGDAVATT